MPLGSFSAGIDGLSAFFLFPILGLGALSAIYGLTYLWPYREHKSLGFSWFLFNLLVASMVMVVVARNVLLFLVAWEVMSLSSFFLVAFENEKQDVREASWIYLIATHLGTAFLLVMFLLLGRESQGSTSFSWAIDSGISRTLLRVFSNWIRTKAALCRFTFGCRNSSARESCSALMSGVMIKTGIYGILRTLTFLSPPPAVRMGAHRHQAVFGRGGVLFALAQHDLKRCWHITASKYRNHSDGDGNRIARHQYRISSPGGPRICRRHPARRKPRSFQRPPVFGRRFGD
jgi:formate hydrogenlyase subunit 3/multisubunit Na+/H+ antiporter MnhD subunit